MFNRLYHNLRRAPRTALQVFRERSWANLWLRLTLALKQDLKRWMIANPSVALNLLSAIEHLPTGAYHVKLIAGYRNIQEFERATRLLFSLAEYASQHEATFQLYNLVRLGAVLALETKYDRERFLVLTGRWKAEPKQIQTIGHYLLSMAREKRIFFSADCHPSETNAFYRKLFKGDQSISVHQCQLAAVVNSTESEVILEARNYQFLEPKVYGRPQKTALRSVELPSFNLYHFREATIKEANTVFVNDKMVVYDHGGHPKFGHVAGTSHHFFGLNDQGEAGIGYFPSKKYTKLSKALLLSGRSTRNYFHWMVEYLPKLIVMQRSKLGLANDLTLLVDANMPKQHFEALEIILDYYHIENPVYRREEFEVVQVDDLWVPTNPTFYPEDFEGEYWPKCAVSNEHLHFIRDAVLKKVDVNLQPRRKIFLTRKPGAARGVSNNAEIEAYLANNGFETIYPENLGFLQQVELIRETKHLVAAGGAALTNLMFAHPELQATVFVSAKNHDYATHKNVGSTSGSKYEHICGLPVLPREHYKKEEDFVHAAYKISVNDLQGHFEELSNSEPGGSDREGQK